MNRTDAKELFINEILANKADFEKQIRSKVYTKDVAEDILQDAYERLWKQMLEPDFDKDPKRWIHGIIKNCILEYWRKAAKGRMVISNIVMTGDGERNLYDTFAANDDILKSIVTNFETGLAYNTLLKIKEDYRVLIHMRYVEEMTPKEMMEATGMKANTLSSKLSRAVKKYRSMYMAAEAGEGMSKNDKTGRK